MRGPTTGAPQGYNFSTGKVALVEGTSPATFLFSVKAAAENREVGLNLEYVVSELELPDPAETIGDYTGSSWLTFVTPLPTTSSTVPKVAIPVPLRAYPSPVTLLAQQKQPSRCRHPQLTSGDSTRSSPPPTRRCSTL